MVLNRGRGTESLSKAAMLLVMLAALGGLMVAAGYVLQGVQVPQAPPVALPEPHQDIPIRDGHYESQKRAFQALQAHALIINPRNDCRFYECENSDSILRECIGPDDTGELIHVLQWIYYAGGRWNEGTVFIQRKLQKVENYKTNWGCKKEITNE